MDRKKEKRTESLLLAALLNDTGSSVALDVLVVLAEASNVALFAACRRGGVVETGKGAGGDITGALGGDQSDEGGNGNGVLHFD